MSHQTTTTPGGGPGAAETTEGGHASPNVPPPIIPTRGSARLPDNRAVALELHAGGWHPIPLPAGRKEHPPAGVTGRGGRCTTTADIEAWTWTGNVAVRLPVGVVGVDVDAYHAGLDSLAELEAQWGPLPPTWRTTSRTDGSGIGFYRVPAGTNLRGNPAAGVDMIQHHHRYALVVPSVHPEGRCYRWHDDAGELTGAMPATDELPELPWRWLEGLAVAATNSVPSADAEAAAAWLARYATGERPHALGMVANDLDNATVGRHDTLVAVACRAMRGARAGWFPASAAIEELRRWWLEVMDDPGRRDGAEFGDAIRWAIAQADAMTPDDLAAWMDPLGSLIAPSTNAPDSEATTSSTPANHHQPRTLELVDWAEVAAGVSAEATLVDGLVFGGRWTAIGAAAKQGKSEFTLNVAHHLAAGREPFTRRPRPAVRVLYLDAEMGRQDMLERLDALEVPDAERLVLHYTDIVPKLDTPDGAAVLLATVRALDAELVVVDGINGALEGAENDDTTWRALFDLTVAPLKRAGVAVVTNANLGKDAGRGPRGSSVQLDKPDGVVVLSRTADGIRLKCDRRRTGAYELDTHLTIAGVDGSAPITYTPAARSWPAGTAELAAVLDALDVDLEASKRTARQALTGARDAASSPAEADRYRCSDPVLLAALHYRRNCLAGLATGPDGSAPPSAPPIWPPRTTSAHRSGRA